MVGFIFGGNTGNSYESLQRRRQIADRLAAQLMANKPKTALEGFAALAAGIGGGINRGRIDAAEEEGSSKAKSFADAILNGGTLGAPSTASQVSAASPASAPGPVAAGGPASYRDAIASIESAGSGDYSAVGPTHPKMGRALGRYQVMEANIGPWSREALGREVTPDEFLKNPQIQDAIFDKQFQGYVQKYGPEGAAQAWFGGPGGVGKTDRKDSLGTSIGGYGSKFMNALGASPQQQVASLDPAAGMGQPETAAQAIEAQAPQQMPPMQPPQMVGPAPAVAGQPMEVAGGGGRPSVFEQPQQAPQQAPQQSPTGGVDPRILQALANPFTPPEMKQSLQILANQQMQQAQMQQEEQSWRSRQNYEQQQRQADPAYQIGLEKDRMQLEQMRNPAAEVPESVQALDMRAQRAGLKPGTQEYQDFMVSGGSKGQTINFRTEIDARRQIASEMGIDPASEEGKRYILTGNLPSGDKGVTAGDREAIREADDMVNSGQATLGLIDRAADLSGKAYEGAGAGARALVASQWGDEGALATREYDNIITEQALGQLKSIFGGAPTEGERAILLDIQGSSSQPKAVRDAILQRARKAVERRVNYNQDRASELRGGTYYKPRDAVSPSNAAPSGAAPQSGRLRFNPQTGDLE